MSVLFVARVAVDGSTGVDGANDKDANGESSLTFQNHIAPWCLCLKSQPHDNQQTPVPLQPTLVE